MKLATSSLLAGMMAALMLAASPGARAEGPGPESGPAPSPTAQDIEAAIAQQAKRRGEGVGTIVIGSLAIVGGLFATYELTTKDNTAPYYDEYGQYHNGESDSGTDWTGVLVGLAIGIPCIVSGARKMTDSGRKTHELQQQRNNLSLVPGPDSLRLTLAHEF